MNSIKADLPPPWNLVFSTAARFLVWGLLFSLLYLLRSFFLLIFLTFVFAYLQNFLVNKLESYVRIRWLRATLVGVFVLSLIVSIFTFLVPQVRKQAAAFASHHLSYLQMLDRQIVEYSAKYEVIGLLFPPEEIELNGSTAQVEWDMKHSRSAKLLQQLAGIGKEGSRVEPREFVNSVKNIVSAILATSTSFLLSLLFSFLIVLDLPRLTLGVRGLRDTKVGFIYQEVGKTLTDFAGVVGSALVAQLFIAIINTFLTAIGVTVLGIGSQVAFLSIIVFLCSFIPVAGVFISSAPICLIAIEQGGIQMALVAALLIWILHLIEAYVLNPHIYGSHLRINPVLVLIILTVAGKLFGAWGLVLGLPVVTYVFTHAIRYPEKELKSTSGDGGGVQGVV